MSGFTTFAITGTGNVGTPIAQNLLKEGKKVVILSRSASTKLEGAETRAVDYTSSSSIESALAGVDVVIAALGMGPETGAVQKALADASKKVGVKLFLPCEFGNPSTGRGGLIAFKSEFQDYLKTIDLPFLLVFSGPFPEFCIDPAFGLDLKGGSLKIVGSGETPIGWTTRKDIGHYVAQHLINTPAADLSFSTLRLEGDRKSFKEIAAIYEKVHPGSKVEIKSTSVEDAKKFLQTPEAKSHAGFFTYLLLTWEEGESPYNDGPINKFAKYKATDIEDLVKSNQI